MALEQKTKTNEQILESAYSQVGQKICEQLLYLRDNLYVGSWQRMEQDLRDRLQGRPHIPKLAARIEEDLGRLSQLRDIEIKYKTNLAVIIQEAA